MGSALAAGSLLGIALGCALGSAFTVVVAIRAGSAGPGFGVACDPIVTGAPASGDRRIAISTIAATSQSAAPTIAMARLRCPACGGEEVEAGAWVERAGMATLADDAV